MVRSATDDDKRALPKPYKTWIMGNIPATGKDFLEWREDQPLLSHGLGVRKAMSVYVQQLNLRSKAIYEMQKKEHEAYLLSTKQ
jgi:hypothetical protein